LSKKLKTEKLKKLLFAKIVLQSTIEFGSTNSSFAAIAKASKTTKQSRKT
jgi:hypothetical protein